MKGHRVRFCAFFFKSIKYKQRCHNICNGKNKHETDERNANKAGRCHQQLYICYPTPMAIKNNSSTLDHVSYSNVQRMYVSECENTQRQFLFLSSQHHCPQGKQHFLSYCWPNSSYKIEKTFMIQIHQDCMTEN